MRKLLVASMTLALGMTALMAAPAATSEAEEDAAFTVQNTVAIDTVPLPERRIAVALNGMRDAIPEVSPVQVPSSNVSAFEAWCHWRHGDDRAGLQQCLNDAKAEQAIALVAASLQQRLMVSFMDHIWNGGDIDPLPLEEGVLERFLELSDR